MEFHQVITFLTIARCGSFTKAASELALSQPALSQQMSLLERELGAKLLERTRMGVVLTEAGREIFEDMLEMEERYISLKEKAKLGKPTLRRITLSSGETIASHILPLFIRNVRKEFANIRLQILAGDRELNRSAILNGRSDISISAEPFSEEFLTSEYLGSDQIIPVVSKKHPLAKKESLKIADLKSENWILFQTGSVIRRYSEDMLSNRIPDFQSKVTMELSNVEAMVQFLKEGFGIGFLSHLSLTRDLKELMIPELCYQRKFFTTYRTSKESVLRPVLNLLQKSALSQGLSN